MSIVATCIVVVGLIYIAIMLPMGRLTATGATGFMVSVLAGALVVAVVVPNTSGIRHLIVKITQYFSISVDMQQAATQAQSDTAEVRQIKAQVQALANGIHDANRRINQSEQMWRQCKPMFVTPIGPFSTRWSLASTLEICFHHPSPLQM